MPRYNGYSFAARVMYFLLCQTYSYKNVCSNFDFVWQRLTPSEKQFLKILARNYTKSEAYKLERQIDRNHFVIPNEWLTSAMKPANCFIAINILGRSTISFGKYYYLYAVPVTLCSVFSLCVFCRSTFAQWSRNSTSLSTQNMMCDSL
jgi:hypothetical protein